MVTQEQFIAHYNNLYNSGAIYLWGGNCEIITKALTDKLYRTFGSATYTKSYYDNKFATGQGKIGADCSGSIYPLSKADATVRGYYNTCTKKGSINNIPTNTACLVFSSGFTHVGAYLGNGYTIEMMNSTRNCVKQALNKSRWAYYGMPSWLEVPGSTTTNTNTAPTTTTVTTKSAIIKNVQTWCNTYCGAGLVVDGAYGPKTKQGLCKALQRCLNIEFNANISVDGAFGPKTKAACKSASKSKTLSYICQAMLYVNGYDMSHSIKNNNFDSSYGAGTKKAVLEYQQNTYGLRHDGDCGPATFYAMFK